MKVFSANKLLLVTKHVRSSLPIGLADLKMPEPVFRGDKRCLR